MIVKYFIQNNINMHYKIKLAQHFTRCQVLARAKIAVEKKIRLRWWRGNIINTLLKQNC